MRQEMETILIVFHLMLSIGLVGLILIQHGKGAFSLTFPCEMHGNRIRAVHGDRFRLQGKPVSLLTSRTKLDVQR